MPEDNFAIREIRKYYEFDSSTKYFKCINQTILNPENRILRKLNGKPDLKKTSKIGYQQEN